jgi:hypothetical protein
VTPIRVTRPSEYGRYGLEMSLAASGQEETPVSQRITLPSPQPFARVPPPPRKRSPGEYRIVNDTEAEVDEMPSTRRSARVERVTDS